MGETAPFVTDLREGERVCWIEIGHLLGRRAARRCRHTPTACQPEHPARNVCDVASELRGGSTESANQRSRSEHGWHNDAKLPEAGSPRVWRDLQRAYFGTFRFTVCMKSMNARNLLGVWARFA